MARREFYDDPDAPAPIRLVVATSAVVTDDSGPSTGVHSCPRHRAEPCTKLYVLRPRG
jgi:hypothetical protein